MPNKPSTKVFSSTASSSSSRSATVRNDNASSSTLSKVSGALTVAPASGAVTSSPQPRTNRGLSTPVVFSLAAGALIVGGLAIAMVFFHRKDTAASTAVVATQNASKGPMSSAPSAAVNEVELTTATTVEKIDGCSRAKVMRVDFELSPLALAVVPNLRCNVFKLFICCLFHSFSMFATTRRPTAEHEAPFENDAQLHADFYAPQRQSSIEAFVVVEYLGVSDRYERSRRRKKSPALCRFLSRVFSCFVLVERLRSNSHVTVRQRTAAYGSV